MLSKDWKFLFVAPICVMFLTACPDKKRSQNAAQPSQFSGVWVNEDLLHLWSECSTSSPGNRAALSKPELFCGELYRENEKYGVGFDRSYNRHKLIIDSWIVSSVGEVYYYNPTGNVNDPAYREANFHGRVDGQGVFTRRDQLNRPVAQGPYGPVRFRPFVMTPSTRVIRSEKSLKIIYEDRGTRNYYLTTEAQLLDIYVAVETCTKTEGFMEGYDQGYPDGRHHGHRGYSGPNPRHHYEGGGYSQDQFGPAPGAAPPPYGDAYAPPGAYRQ